LVPGPVIMPGLSPSTRPMRPLGVSVVGKSGSIQGTVYTPKYLCCTSSRAASSAELPVHTMRPFSST